MKASNVIATSILTTILLVGGGTVAAYADEGTPTESQEVTSSPESTQQISPGSSPTGPTTGTASPVATPTSTSVPPATEPPAEPSHPTAKTDDGTSTPTATSATPTSANTGTGGPPPSTTTTASPVAASAPKASNKGHTPVLICHKDQEITVDDSAVAAHLAHGDNLGKCFHGAPLPVESVEIWWAMPNGGTASNVTWPQTYASSNNLECSVTYQVDTYLKSEAQNFTLDGVLYQGEDYQNSTQRGAISWRFVYGGDCPVVTVPDKPAVTEEVLDDHTTRDCQPNSTQGVSTEVITKVIHDWIFNQDTNTWVANDRTQTFQIVKEVSDCPVSTPTTPTPPTTPSVPNTPTPGTSSATVGHASTTATHSTGPSTVKHQPTRSLAKTGDNGMLVAFLFLLGVLLLALGTAAVISTRRHN